MISVILFKLTMMVWALFADVRTVNVTITTTSGGAPIAAVPICVRDGYDDTYGVTNTGGVVIIQKEVSPHQKWLAVMPRCDERRPNETIPEFKSREAAELAKLRQFGFKEYYRLALIDGQQTYSVKVEVEPARVVDLRVMKGSEPARGALVHSASGGLSATSNEMGAVTFRGVTRSAEDIFVSSGRSCVRLRIPAGNSDVNLGDVQLPSDNDECELHLTISNWNRLDKTLVPLNEGLTLVSPDGTKIISLHTRPSEQPNTAITAGANGNVTKVPPGKWYIAPGYFLGTPTQTRLIERLANGESVASIPTVEAVSAQPMSLQFDAMRAEQAINAN